MKRHWSFIVTDKRYLYAAALLILCTGLAASILLHDSSMLSRSGNFIIGTGVWMGMRFTLREGINKYKDAADLSPTVPGTNQMNASYFNRIAFAIGDAQLQVHGFVLVLIGSAVGSFGDLALRAILPGCF